MKPIEKDELFQHLSQFLKSKGIEMKDGSYSGRIQKGCGLLSDVVNLTQKGMEKAKSEIDKRLDQMRQVIHEKTAPQARPTAASPSENQETGTTAKARKRAKPSRSGAKRRRKT